MVWLTSLFVSCRLLTFCLSCRLITRGRGICKLCDHLWCLHFISGVNLHRETRSGTGSQTQKQHTHCQGTMQLGERQEWGWKKPQNDTGIGVGVRACKLNIMNKRRGAIKKCVWNCSCEHGAGMHRLVGESQSLPYFTPALLLPLSKGYTR